MVPFLRPIRGEARARQAGDRTLAWGAGLPPRQFLPGPGVGGARWATFGLQGRECGKGSPDYRWEKPQPEHVHRAMEGFLEKLYAGWPDQHLPYLDDRTPARRRRPRRGGRSCSACSRTTRTGRKGRDSGASRFSTTPASAANWSSAWNERTFPRSSPGLRGRGETPSLFGTRPGLPRDIFILYCGGCLPAAVFSDKRGWEDRLTTGGGIPT